MKTLSKKQLASFDKGPIVEETDPFDDLDEILGVGPIGNSKKCRLIRIMKQKKRVMRMTQKKMMQVSEDLDYDPKGDEGFDDDEHILKDVHVSMNSFNPDTKHDLSIAIVEVHKHDLDVIDYDLFGSDLDNGIDSERRSQLRPPKKRKKSIDELASQSCSISNLYMKGKSCKCSQCINLVHNKKGCKGRGGASQAGVSSQQATGARNNSSQANGYGQPNADPETWKVLKAKFKESLVPSESCTQDAFRKRDHDNHADDNDPHAREKEESQTMPLEQQHDYDAWFEILEVDENEVILKEASPALLNELKSLGKGKLPIIANHKRMEATLKDMMSNQFKDVKEKEALVFYGPQRNTNKPLMYFYNKDLFYPNHGNTSAKKDHEAPTVDQYVRKSIKRQVKVIDYVLALTSVNAPDVDMGSSSTWRKS
nr:hypothetical protein [Tanacetum cinerariifolium]